MFLFFDLILLNATFYEQIRGLCANKTVESRRPGKDAVASAPQVQQFLPNTPSVLSAPLTLTSCPRHRQLTVQTALLSVNLKASLRPLQALGQAYRTVHNLYHLAIKVNHLSSYLAPRTTLAPPPSISHPRSTLKARVIPSAI